LSREEEKKVSTEKKKNRKKEKIFLLFLFIEVSGVVLARQVLRGNVAGIPLPITWLGGPEV